MNEMGWEKYDIFCNSNEIITAVNDIEEMILWYQQLFDWNEWNGLENEWYFLQQQWNEQK